MANNIGLDHTDTRKFIVLMSLAYMLFAGLVPMTMIVDIGWIPISIKYLLNPILRTMLAMSLGIGFYLAWNGSIRGLSYLSSLNFFVIIAKFSYSTFMIHFPVIWYHIGTLRHQMEFSLYTGTMDIIAIHGLSIVFGFLLYILVEAPGVGLVKMALTKDKKKADN